MDRNMIPQWAEFFVYSNTFLQLIAGSGMQYVPAEMRIDSDATFQFMKTMYFSTNDNADPYIKFKDDTTSAYLLKYATQLRSIAGRSLSVDNSGSFDFRPFVWPIPYLIQKSTTLSIEIANNSQQVADIYLAFHGGKIRQGIAPWKRPGYRRIPYIYPLTRNLTTIPEGSIQIPANQTIPVSISTDKGSDFVVRKLTGSATGPCLVMIQDGGRERQWFNLPCHFRNLVGSGAFPNVLAAPRFVSRGSVLSIVIQDLSGATNNVVLNLIGEKLVNRG